MEVLLQKEEKLLNQIMDSTDPKEIMALSKEIGLEMPMENCEAMAKRHVEMQSVVLEADN